MQSAQFTADLPGRFRVDRGSFADYQSLARFHYRPGKPATFAGVWVVRFKPFDLYGDSSRPSQLAAVGVLSYPAALCRERHAAFNMHGWTLGQRLAFINRNIRTISRVIVHPQFRAAGLATSLVRHLLRNCPTRYVEALAAMGRVHPFFERAGMTRLDPDDPRRPVYFHFDRSTLEAV